MKTKLLAMLLLAGGSMFAQTRFSIGIGIGGPVQGYYVPPPSYAYVAPYPGDGFYWVGRILVAVPGTQSMGQWILVQRAVPSRSLPSLQQRL
jgi:hypothetical protein